MRDAVTVRANKPDWRCTACRRALAAPMQTACTRQRVCQSVNGARHPPGRQPTNQPAAAVYAASGAAAQLLHLPLCLRESIMLICEAAVFSANQYGTQLECYSFTPPRERRLFYFACLHQKKGSGLETTTTTCLVL